MFTPDCLISSNVIWREEADDEEKEDEDMQVKKRKLSGLPNICSGQTWTFADSTEVIPCLSFPRSFHLVPPGEKTETNMRRRTGLRYVNSPPPAPLWKGSSTLAAQHAGSSTPAHTLLSRYCRD